MPSPDDRGVVSLPLCHSGGAESPAAACSAWTGPSCVLPNATSAYFSEGRVVCVVPPGVGTGFHLLLRDSWTLLPSAGYARPVVTAVAPSRVNVTGGPVTITGVDFGEADAAQLGVGSFVHVVSTPQPPSEAALSFNVTSRSWLFAVGGTPVPAPCRVTRWAPTAIECDLPPGVDPAPVLRVTVGGQVNATVGLMGYAGPVVTRVTPLGALGTPGGTVLAINGSGFPLAPWPLVVVVGDTVCGAVPNSRTVTGVQCYLPRGAGVAAVTVHTPVQASLPSDVPPLVYARPEITSVDTPQGRPIEGGFRVVVRGRVRTVGAHERGPLSEVLVRWCARRANARFTPASGTFPSKS
jgi:hypothetical protein